VRRVYDKVQVLAKPLLHSYCYQHEDVTERSRIGPLLVLGQCQHSVRQMV
jgi:hypothetical protein